MSEILEFSHLPQTAQHHELIALVGEQQSVPDEPRELSPAGGAVLIAIGVVAVGVLTWMNEHKGKYHSRLHNEQRAEDYEEQR